jgi:mRNA interferase YafQ
LLESFRTNKFKREFALAERRGKNMDELIEVMSWIITERPLPDRCHNHPLHGKKYEGKWECHVEPDWLLVYKINPDAKTVTFHRTGTHAGLFKK